jgi:hypothetical protein
MASEEIFASGGCKFCGLLPRKILHTCHLLSWDGDMPACAIGRLDASQMQPTFAKGLPLSLVREVMASGGIRGSVGCKFPWLLRRNAIPTRPLVLWDEQMSACRAGRLDASQVQPAFTARSLPQPRAGTEKR